MSDNLHYFSAKEYVVQKKFQNFRDGSLKFLVKPLIFLKITPDIVTFASFLCVLIFSYFLVTSPYIALTFLFLHVALDGIDGVLARLTNKSSRAGAFLDILNDHTGFIVVIGALIFYNFLIPILGFVYVYLYSLLVVLLVYCNSLDITPKFTLRTKYLLYIVYAIYALSGLNFFQPAVFIFTILTVPFATDIFLRVLFHLNKKPS